ncbi:MAG: Smr/MutS family protein [Dehalococcoidales bacterium]|nr:Smr/MutS family protein [Dehalococcoidales bacterium]
MLESSSERRLVNDDEGGWLPLPGEIHLRRLTVDEALFKLDGFLDNAFMDGLTCVRVVHGRGVGVLRRAVWEVLKKHTLVKSFRPGGYGEGGAGVTIVEMESR